MGLSALLSQELETATHSGVEQTIQIKRTAFIENLFKVRLNYLDD